MSVTTDRSTHATAIRPFTIDVPQAGLEALRARLAATRWPEKETIDDASQGVQLATMQALARYWEPEYDWRKTNNHRRGGTSTESTVLGPFHMVESPKRELGDNIALDGKGTPCLVSGQGTGPDGEPPAGAGGRRGGGRVAGAVVDVWQTNEDGFYDVQQPGIQPAGNLRGLFTADEQGRFWFRSVVPRYYPIPDDGPAGPLLAATGRHPNRPAHLHFIVAAPGYRPVTTHVFVAAGPYLDSAPVFGVKESLIREVPEVDDPAQAAEVGLANPFRTLTYDLTLLREGQAPPAA